MTQLLTRRSFIRSTVTVAATLAAPAVFASGRGLIFMPDAAESTARIVTKEDHNSFCYCLRDVAYDNAFANMDRHLHVRLHWLAEQFNADGVYITSGFRIQRHQDALRQRNSSLPKRSFHTDAKATDFRLIKGSSFINSHEVARFARANLPGGVGTYPTFTHLDTGPNRHWRG